MSRPADMVAVFGPLAGITACLVGAFRAQGDDVPLLEHVISNTTDGAADEAFCVSSMARLASPGAEPARALGTECCDVVGARRR
jgi:hypothetical protein